MNKENLWEYEPVPPAASQLFRMCWQLEAWLRLMVYVELRAHRLDWEEPLKQAVGKKQWPPGSLANDKEQHHMATRHQAALSYLTFGELWSVIGAPEFWPRFEPYFPPKDNVLARIKEVKAIRNRVAHFREPHAQDIDRFRLFIRDMEGGVKRFCARYKAGWIDTIPSKDPVHQQLKASWEQTGYGVELRWADSDWLYAPGRHRMTPLIHAAIERIFPLPKGVSPAPDIYMLRITSLDRFLDSESFLGRTKAVHGEIIHIMLEESGRDIAVTIPAVHGAVRVASLIGDFLSAGGG